MQNTDPTEPGREKPRMKKRQPRPWKDESPDTEAIQASTSMHTTPIQNIPELEAKLSEKVAEKHSQEHALKKMMSHNHKSVVIGGFLDPLSMLRSGEGAISPHTKNLLSELNHKEREILALSHDLQLARAMEALEHAELGRQKEESARKSAEEKALFAIEQAKIAAERTLEAERQSLEDQRQKVELEKIKKILETNLETSLKEVEVKSHQIEDYKKSIFLMEEKIENTKKECENKVQESLEYLSISEKKFEHEKEEKLQNFKNQMETKINLIQKESDRKIQEAQEQAYFHEKAKISAQNWAQKTLDTARQTDTSKTELEKKLELATLQAQEDKNRYEKQLHSLLEKIRAIETQKKTIENNQSISAKMIAQAKEDKAEAKKQIETLSRQLKVIEEDREKIMADKKALDERYRATMVLLSQKNDQTIQHEQQLNPLVDQIKELEKQKAALDEGRAVSSKLLTQAMDNVRKLEIIVDNEKNLRKVLEKKMSSAQVRKEEILRKTHENTIANLELKVKNLENEKNLMEDKLHKVQKTIRNLELLQASTDL